MERIDADVATQRDMFQAQLKRFGCTMYKADDGKNVDMTSDIFVLIFEDFMIFKNNFDNANEQIKKTIFVPKFCRGISGPVDVECLEILWELKAPEEKKPQRRDKKEEKGDKDDSAEKPKEKQKLKKH